VTVARSVGERLGVYQDGPFTIVERDGESRLAPHPVDLPFLRFVGGVAEHFDALVVFARVVEVRPAQEGDLFLPADVGVVRLPDYGNLTRLGAVLRASAQTGAAFWRGLSRVDLVWTFGPQPFEILLVVLAALRGKKIVIGVRQETPAYFRARLPDRRWKPVLVLVGVLDAAHRLIARRARSTVVGPLNERRYSVGRAPVLAMSPTLVTAADVLAEPPERDWSGVVELLTVGRIDPEKNPFLVLDTLAELERVRPGRYRLRWAGVGPLAEQVQRRAEELGIEDRVTLLGYVPMPGLLEIYRSAHIFVHVSLTEGVPQVLVEALASGIPVVATDVGGVATGLSGGEAGLLVPPADRDALTRAVLRLTDDAALRAGFAARGLELARARTLEAEAARVAAFMQQI
jgi:glycosyltransferase involved in cell wall biosynthesis